MRTFEIITILYLLAIHIERMVRKNKLKSFWQYGILVPVVLHIVIEGARWQMALVYLMIVCIIVFSVITDIRGKLPFSGKKWMYITGISITIFSIVLLTIMPVNNMRKPSGEYMVGTRTYDLVDESRVELYGDRKGDARKIRIQLWYPTNDDVTGSIAPWIQDGTVVPRQLLVDYGVPTFLYDHITLIKSNSYVDAPLNSSISKIPVVILSHGWTGFRNLHTDLGEMFASMGYLAISIDHTYGSIGLRFDDGKTAVVDQKALPDREDTDSFLTYAGNLVDTYSGDVELVLEHLVYLNEQSDIFKDNINLDLIGAIGHSTGGGGVVSCAILNPMIDVVIGLDPWVEPIGSQMLSNGLKQPSMFFRSTSWAGGINEEYIKLMNYNLASDITSYEITGSKHQDFSMLYQMGPLPAILGISGEPKGYKSAKIQQYFIANFMNHCLLGEEDKTDSLLSKYELVFEINY